jgi:hypothetical protein
MRSNNTKTLSRIFAQSGNRPDFVSGEEEVAMATHILRVANSRMETRLAVVAPIVANRAANGKPLVPRASARWFWLRQKATVLRPNPAG